MDTGVLTFPELCHGCGGCRLVCPTGAITESRRQTGEMQIGPSGAIQCVQGLLNIGEAMAPPVIAEVKRAAPEADLMIFDSPPGTSCPVIESIRGCDLVLLVTEPTPFGLNDLKLAVHMVRAMSLPFGVVINRADVGDDLTGAYCREEKIPVLAEIPDDREVAEAYSRGAIACRALPRHRDLYSRLLASIESIVAGAEGATR
jgi:MinD superfamily P-loop ATPase